MSPSIRLATQSGLETALKTNMQRLGRTLAPAGRLIARVAGALFRRYELDEHIIGGWKSSSGIHPVVNPNAPSDVLAAGAARRQANLLRRQMRAYLRTL